MEFTLDEAMRIWMNLDESHMNSGWDGKPEDQNYSQLYDDSGKAADLLRYLLPKLWNEKDIEEWHKKNP